MSFARIATAILLSLVLASPALAGSAQGKLTLAGETVALNVANAMSLTNYEGKSITLVVLTEAPIDLSSVVASSEPDIALRSFAPLTAVSHATVFISAGRVSISAHRSGDDTQYLTSQKLGLEAKITGGGATPLEGNLSSTTSRMGVQIEVTFKADVVQAGS